MRESDVITSAPTTAPWRGRNGGLGRPGRTRYLLLADNALEGAFKEHYGSGNEVVSAGRGGSRI